MLFQIRIGKAEMLVPEEPVISGKGRRMGGSQHKMAAAVYHGSFLLSVCPPQDKYQMFPLSANALMAASVNSSQP